MLWDPGLGANQTCKNKTKKNPGTNKRGRSTKWQKGRGKNLTSATWTWLPGVGQEDRYTRQTALLSCSDDNYGNKNRSTARDYDSLQFFISSSPPFTDDFPKWPSSRWLGWQKIAPWDRENGPGKKRETISSYPARRRSLFQLMVRTIPEHVGVHRGLDFFSAAFIWLILPPPKRSWTWCDDGQKDDSRVGIKTAG